MRSSDVLVIGGLVDHANVAERVGAACRVAQVRMRTDACAAAARRTTPPHTPLLRRLHSDRRARPISTQAHGIRTARLPIDEFISIRKTSLTCLACVQILANAIANGGDWWAAVRDAPALRCAPMRKYVHWKRSPETG